MKIFFRNIHLYLGLVAGLVVMTTCFTGAVLVFEEELQHAFHHNRYFVQPSSQALPLEQLVHNVEQKLPGSTVVSVKVYQDAARSVEIGYSEQQKKQPKQAGPPSAGNAPARGGEGSRRTAFVNPYTGSMIELYAYRDSFFYTMFDLHRWLLSGDTGKMIVGVCTLIFLFILITGIILWWPRNKAILRQRLRIKWSAGWKRLNHDFHLVLGFYTAIFLFVFAFTGLAWSFQWFNTGIYTLTRSPMQPPKPPKPVFAAGEKTIGIDALYRIAGSELTEVEFLTINLPKDPADAISVTSLSRHAPHETASDVTYYNQYSGQRIGQLLFANRSAGAKVRATFKPVHTGSIFGLPSKIIALLACLAGVTFPVTGVIMWINRIRKKAPVKGKTADKLQETVRVS